MMPPNQLRAEQRPPQRDRIYNNGNVFEFDERKVPAGYKYEWKRCKLAGQEDEDNLIIAEQNGWKPVPASRHPELSGQRKAAENPEAVIVKRGLMLMQQPIEYYEEAREMDKFAADNTIEQQIQRLGLQARQNGARGVGRSREQVNLPVSRRRMSNEGAEIVE
jgi:hypothetical protein